MTFKSDSCLWLQVPHLGEPFARAFPMGSQFLAWAGECDAYRNHGRCTYEVTTARELADCFGAVLTAAPDEDRDDPMAPTIRALAAEHGADAKLYRADYLRDEGEYTADPIDEVEAYTAFLGRDASASYLVTSAEEYSALFDRLTGPNAPRIGKCGPVRAALELYAAAVQLGWASEEADESEKE